MIVVTPSQKLQYELANVARLFFPAEQVTWLTEMPEEITDAVVTTMVDGNTYTVTMELPQGTKYHESADHTGTLDPSLLLGKLLYFILSEITGRTIDWGVLTGIRPIKLARKLRTSGKSAQEIEDFFTQQYMTSKSKAVLCRLTDQVQQDIVHSNLPKGYSLYISIPFCPSRCSYCSFVSHSIEKTWKLIPDYVKKLCEELLATASVVKDMGLQLQSVYMGGGTPTVLTADQMEKVLTTVNQHFDLTNCAEFTVEAGRPDTITAAKLDVMKKLGVDRVSVNCQTINDDILESIGRKHTAKEFFDAFALVKTYGFTAINVDLIAGLPDDTLVSFKNSIDGVIALKPENITVHALTVKRAARLIEDRSTILDFNNVEKSEVASMVDYSQEMLGKAGYLPYYLYRQKGTVDSLENVGYSLGDTQCKYNVFIMDETHTIISAGAGGVTKLVMENAPDSEHGDNVRIERIFNHKYPYEYMDRFDEILERKTAIRGYPL